MAKPHPRSSRLNQLDALFGVLSDVHTRTSELRKEVVRLETIASHGDLPEEWHQGHWDELTNDPEADAEDERLLTEMESSYWGGVVADVIREVRRFRSEIRAALEAVAAYGAAMDGVELTPNSWSLLVDGELQKLRASILCGQPRDFCASCLPWVGQGVGEALSAQQAVIYTRMREVNSMRSLLRKRAAAKPLKPSRTAKPKSRKPASPAVPNIVREAETRHEAKLREDEQKLLADPSFMAAVKQGEHWERARAAVAKAQAPLQAELDALIAKHPVNPPESKIGKRIRALIWAIQETQLRVLAEHGITERKRFTTPMEMLEALRKFKWSGWTTIQEITDRPRPTDTLWADAETIRGLNPSLPPLPEKPDDGRTRFFLLYRWCERCLNLPEEEIAAFIHEPEPTDPNIEECSLPAGSTLTQAVEWFLEPVKVAISHLETGPMTEAKAGPGWRMPKRWEDPIVARYVAFVGWCQTEGWLLDHQGRSRPFVPGEAHAKELRVYWLATEYRKHLDVLKRSTGTFAGQWVNPDGLAAMKSWVQGLEAHLTPSDPTAGAHSLITKTQTVGGSKPQSRGWTKQFLCKAAEGLGTTSFDRLRKKAGVRPSPRRKKGRLFTPDEVRAMITVAVETLPEVGRGVVAAWTRLVEV